MADRRFRILAVCRANICRSVMAERLLQRAVEARGVEVAVSSCGLLFDGEPASATVVQVLAERGIDASDHSSRRFDPALLEGIDLVVTMERSQARALLVASDGVAGRVHTLGGLVALLAESAGPGLGTPADRVADAAARRSPAALQGTGPDEVADPHGRSRRIHRRTADQLEDLAARLIDGLFPA